MKADAELAHLKKYYKYQQWRGRNTLAENLFIWKFFLSGNEFPNWHAHKIKTKQIKDWPSSIKSIWQSDRDKNERLLRVDVFECISRDAAHNFLLSLLGEFQSPLILTAGELGIGDISFTVQNGTSILAARANIVFRFASVGPQRETVGNIARKFDVNLLSKDKKESARVFPEILRFDTEVKESRVDVSQPLNVEAQDPLNRPLWYKFFSPFGEVLLEDNQLVYRPSKAGSQTITAIVFNADGGMARQELKLSAIGKKENM